jgi:hypothetical protein
LLEVRFTVWISMEAKNTKECSKVHIPWVSWVVDDCKNLVSLILKSESTNRVDELINWDVSTSVIVKDIEDFL